MSEIHGPRLFAEIVDQVLQNFDHHKDRSTLCKCGLVSRTWLALSRSILFSSIAVNRSIPYNDGRLKVYQGATIWPYLPNFLAQFPELSTLWLTDPMVLLVAYACAAQLERLCNEHRPRLGIVARLRLAFTKLSHFTCRETTVDVIEDEFCGPFSIQERTPLAQLHTVHIDHLECNVPVLALLALPTLTTLHLTLRESDPGVDSVHACLRAAGTALCTLTLSFPWHLRIGQPSTPLPLPGLRTLCLRAEEFPRYCSDALVLIDTSMLISLAARLLGCVLAPPRLEELRIEMDVLESDGEGLAAARADLERVLRTLPTLNIVYIPT
ncbi:hypothetical protein B0H14DRAFT_2562104 [Mycena olivaceomarginata]|nr:hypothetical protein B0H14DRAFT_2562104 [Mycena olivaceomarginata]